MTKIKRIKQLTKSIPYKAGRDSSGRVSIRFRGGRHKRLYRIIDFKRDKHGVPARVADIQYDPNRGSDIALLVYSDGEKRYVLCPMGLKVGRQLIAGENAPLDLGNALPIKKIPVGTQVHNVELRPGNGGQMARGAGNFATVMARDAGFARIKLPSGEIRMVKDTCYATIGQLSNVEKKHEKLGKAGRKRYLGFRPHVRGVAMSPNSHPHGGGEGKSGIGMKSPKSPWGKRTLGKKTRSPRKKNRFIIEKR